MADTDVETKIFTQMKLSGQWSNLEAISDEDIATEKAWVRQQNRRRGGEIFRLVRTTTSTEVLA